MSTARICKECGKKFYPKSYYSYPQFGWRTPDEVKLENARFHSQGCMHEYFDMYKDRILTMVGEQGKQSRKATEDGPYSSWQKQEEYNLPWNEGYHEARTRFIQSWIRDNIRS